MNDAAVKSLIRIQFDIPKHISLDVTCRNEIPTPYCKQGVVHHFHVSWVEDGNSHEVSLSLPHLEPVITPQVT